jgi:hypothetical protein
MAERQDNERPRGDDAAGPVVYRAINIQFQEIKMRAVNTFANERSCAPALHP